MQTLLNLESSDNLLERLQAISSEIKSQKGKKIMFFLLKNPNINFPFFYFVNGFNDNENQIIDNVDLHLLQKTYQYFIRSRVYKCDAQTKNEVMKRYKELLKKMELIADKECINFINIEKESAKIYDYLTDILTQSGKIKCFDEGLKKTRNSIMIAIRRYLSEITSVDSELVNLMLKKLLIKQYTIMLKS